MTRTLDLNCIDIVGIWVQPLVHSADFKMTIQKPIEGAPSSWSCILSSHWNYQVIANISKKKGVILTFSEILVSDINTKREI